MPTSNTIFGQNGGNVHVLPTDMMSIERVLRRLTAVDGPSFLDFAGRRSLIVTAIAAARQETLRMSRILDELTQEMDCNPTAEEGSQRERVAMGVSALLKEILADSEVRLRILEEQLSLIEREAAGIAVNHRTVHASAE